MYSEIDVFILAGAMLNVMCILKLIILLFTFALRLSVFCFLIVVIALIEFQCTRDYLKTHTFLFPGVILRFLSQT